MCIPARFVIGSDGCDSTGASIDFSSIMDSAKFPVKHMPIAPTPGPPHSACACAASARSHTVMGLDALEAKARNSALTHPRSIVTTAPGIRGGAPSSPNRWGMKTVKPASRTQRANRATWGLMPGISVITITAGPLPAT